ncbi:MAG: acetyl-CoA carboxylase biotin carboxyl carrier protein subunit [Bacteroidota bacterium]
MKAILNGQEEVIFDLSEKKIQFDLLQEGKFLNIIHNNQSCTCEILSVSHEEKKVGLRLNGKEIHVQLEDELDLLLKTMGITSGQSAKVKQIKSPMPGLVLSINCSEGQQVQKDDVLLILEAMKMENAIKSPQDGVIKSIHVKAGTAIEKGVVMITFE